MNKKIIIVVAAVVILAGVGTWYFIGRPSIKEMISPTAVSPVEKSTETTASAGWSILANEEQAVDEAVDMMLEKLKKNPDFALVFCASGYNEEKVLTEVRRLLPGTKILGGNSGYGVTTPGGYFWYPAVAQSLSILGVATPKIVWGVGSASVEGISSRETAKQALLLAMKNAGKKETEKPNLVINISSFGMEHEETLKGIADVLGKDVPVFGAYSADKGIKGDWRILANDKIYHDGVALAVVYTDLKIGFYKEHGFEVTEGGGTATKVDGKNLLEIDGRPAAEVYNELIGGLLTDEVENPTTTSAKLTKIRVTGALNPLAKITRVAGKEPFYIPAMIVNILPDRSLQLDITAQKGDELRY